MKTEVRVRLEVFLTVDTLNSYIALGVVTEMPNPLEHEITALIEGLNLEDVEAVRVQQTDIDYRTIVTPEAS